MALRRYMTHTIGATMPLPADELAYLRSRMGISKQGPVDILAVVRRIGWTYRIRPLTSMARDRWEVLGGVIDPKRRMFLIEERRPLYEQHFTLARMCTWVEMNPLSPTAPSVYFRVGNPFRHGQEYNHNVNADIATELMVPHEDLIRRVWPQCHTLYNAQKIYGVPTVVIARALLPRTKHP